MKKLLHSKVLVQELVCVCVLLPLPLPLPLPLHGEHLLNTLEHALLNTLEHALLNTLEHAAFYQSFLAL